MAEKTTQAAARPRKKPAWRTALLAAGLVLLALILLLVCAAVIFILPYLPKPDPLLTGRHAVQQSDLPPSLAGKSETELRKALADALKQAQGDGEWWKTRVEPEQARKIVLLGRMLGDSSATVRGLLWYARGGHIREPHGSSLPYLDAAFAQANAAGLYAEAGRACIERGEHYKEIGLYHRAVEDYTHSIGLFERSGNRTQAAVAYDDRAAILWRRMGEAAKAADGFERSSKLRQESSQPAANRLPVLTLAAMCARDAGDFPRAEQGFKAAVVLARQTGDNDKLYGTLGSAGDFYAGIGQFESALPYLQEAQKLEPEVTELYSLDCTELFYPKLLNRLGLSQQAQAALADVIADAQRRRDHLQGSAGTKFDLSEIDELAVQAQLVSGSYYLRAGEPEQALKRYEEAADEVPADDYLNRKSLALTGEGSALLELQRYAEALHVLEEADQSSASRIFPTVNKLGDPVILVPEARAYIGLGKLAEAERCLARVRQYERQPVGTWSAAARAETQRWLGALRVKQGRRDEARKCYAAAFGLLTGEGWHRVWAYPVSPESIAQLRETGADYAALLREYGKEKDAARVEAVCARAEAARRFILAEMPCGNAARQSLEAYLSTITLAADLQWRLDEVRTGSALLPLCATLISHPDYVPPQYIPALWLEQRRIAREIKPRLKQARRAADAALAGLRRLDPATAELVALAPRS
jgi:tetratricopeptide (TPR) repeat protein